MNQKRRDPKQNLADMRNFMASALTKTVARKARYDCAAKRYGVLAGMIWLVLIALLCTADFSELSGGISRKILAASKLETQPPVDDADHASPQTAELRNEPIWRITLAGMASLIPNAKLQNEAKQGKYRDNPLHRNGLRRARKLIADAVLHATVTETCVIGSGLGKEAVSRAGSVCVNDIPKAILPSPAPAFGRPLTFFNQPDRSFPRDALVSIAGPRPYYIGVMRAGNRPIYLPGGI